MNKPNESVSNIPNSKTNQHFTTNGDGTILAHPSTREQQSTLANSYQLERNQFYDSNNNNPIRIASTISSVNHIANYASNEHSLPSIRNNDPPFHSNENAIYSKPNYSNHQNSPLLSINPTASNTGGIKNIIHERLPSISQVVMSHHIPPSSTNTIRNSKSPIMNASPIIISQPQPPALPQQYQHQHNDHYQHHHYHNDHYQHSNKLSMISHSNDLQLYSKQDSVTIQNNMHVASTNPPPPTIHLSPTSIRNNVQHSKQVVTSNHHALLNINPSSDASSSSSPPPHPTTINTNWNYQQHSTSTTSTLIHPAHPSQQHQPPPPPTHQQQHQQQPPPVSGNSGNSGQDHAYFHNFYVQPSKKTKMNSNNSSGLVPAAAATTTANQKNNSNSNNNTQQESSSLLVSTSMIASGIPPPPPPHPPHPPTQQQPQKCSLCDRNISKRYWVRDCNVDVMKTFSKNEGKCVFY